MILLTCAWLEDLFHKKDLFEKDEDETQITDLANLPILEKNYSFWSGLTAKFLISIEVIGKWFLLTNMLRN